MMKSIFAVLLVPQTMDLTCCYENKNNIFYIHDS